MHDDMAEGWDDMTNSDAHGRANQHIRKMHDIGIDDALRTFPFRLGMPDDVLPDAPVFGMFEQVVNPLAIDGQHDDNTPIGRRHDDQNEASDAAHDEDGDATIDTGTSQPTVRHAGTAGDTLASRETQRGRYDGMAWNRAARHADTDDARRDGHAQASDGDTGERLPSCGASMKPSQSFPSSASDTNDDVQDIRHDHRPLDDGTFTVPDCDEIMRAIVDAYAARDDGIGDANARAVDDAIGWCDGDMSTALAFSRHVDVVRTAGIIGSDAVKAVSGLWDVDGGIGGMLASMRGYVTELMPYSSRGSMTCGGRDAWHGVSDHRNAMHETGVSEFQRRLVGIIGMLGNAAGRQSVCTVSFPICYPDRPLLVPLCDEDYDAHEWLGRQYWRKIPMHLGEDGRMHEDAWLTSRETLPGDGTSAIAVRRNGELVPQWCAWTEDLHVAGLALGMLHDVLAERSGLLSLSIAERDGGDLVGTVRKVWEWCAAYAWYL